jgi:hypothetical protein
MEKTIQEVVATLSITKKLEEFPARRPPVVIGTTGEGCAG